MRRAGIHVVFILLGALLLLAVLVALIGRDEEVVILATQGPQLAADAVVRPEEVENAGGLELSM